LGVFRLFPGGVKAKASFLSARKFLADITRHRRSLVSEMTLIKREEVKAMTEKKNGDYEKPESHGEGDELEGVSGGIEGRREPCSVGKKDYRDCDHGYNAVYCHTGSGN
jgi:hypothetical protein